MLYFCKGFTVMSRRPHIVQRGMDRRGQGLWPEGKDVSLFIFNLFVLSSNLFSTSALGLFYWPLAAISKKNSPALHWVPTTIFPIFPALSPLSPMYWALIKKLANQSLPQNFELKDEDTIGRWWWTLWLIEETLESQDRGISEPYSQWVNKGSRWKENWEQICKEKQRWGAM